MTRNKKHVVWLIGRMPERFRLNFKIKLYWTECRIRTRENRRNSGYRTECKVHKVGRAEDCRNAIWAGPECNLAPKAVSNMICITIVHMPKPKIATAMIARQPVFYLSCIQKSVKWGFTADVWEQTNKNLYGPQTFWENQYQTSQSKYIYPLQDQTGPNTKPLGCHIPIYSVEGAPPWTILTHK